MTDAAPSPSRRLRPGVVVLTREPGVLQIGVDPPLRSLLPDVRDVRRLVDALTHGAAVDPAALAPGGSAARALDQLERAGLLVAADAADMEAALSARHGPAAGPRLAARGAAHLYLDVAPRLRPDVRRLVAAAGLATTAAAEEADLALVVADRWLDRSRLDGWVRDGVPHLCVEAHGGGFVVGPLVVAGATACLRCVDAHRGEDDPLRPLVVERAAARPEPAPHDPLGAALALAWAVRDLRRMVEGERPETWSATLEVDVAGAPARLAPRAWARHPCCGCGWDVRVSA